MRPVFPKQMQIYLRTTNITYGKETVMKQMPELLMKQSVINIVKSIHPPPKDTLGSSFWHATCIDSSELQNAPVSFN